MLSSPAGFRKETVRNRPYGDAMTNDTPWEPPMAGTEVEHLLGTLDRLRTTFRWKADDLDAAGLRTRVGASTLTLAGLLKHLAAVEDYHFAVKFAGEPMGGPWDEFRLGRQQRLGVHVGRHRHRPRSCTRCGTARWSGPGRGSTRRWPTAASTRPPRSPGPTVAAPACAGWSAT